MNQNNAGFMSRCEDRNPQDRDQLFMQEGRKVFKEVCPLVAKMITKQLQKNEIEPSNVKRFWLHQANASMNELTIIRSTTSALSMPLPRRWFVYAVPMRLS